MSESLTEGDNNGAAASTTEPTATAPVTTTPAESQNQETNSGGQNNSQGSDQQDDTASNQNKNNQNGSDGSSSTDDSLAKFAKSQGVEDVSTPSENEQKFLKIAHDNQKAFRQESNKPQPKVSDAAAELGKPADDATEVQKLASKVAAFEYKQSTDQFWAGEGKDRALESKMVQVLNEKKEKFGKDYAYSLSQDLDTLYAMAQLSSGAIDTNAAKEEGRREERDSIRQQQGAGAPQSHATSQSQGAPKIDRQWIKDTYVPGNPEHEALFAEALARGDLY